MKKQIKINYAGFWNGFDYKKYRIQQILEKYYDVCISEEPDYIFCSVYNNDFLKYKNVIRIFYTAENVIPDFNLFDYSIGFDEMDFGDRYIRIPNFLMNPKYDRDLKLMERRHETNKEIAVEFCSYVCSNGQADSMREYIFDEISKYKNVASGGRYRNNIGLPEGVKDKLEFQRRYKFALALENTSYSGYTTEKLVEAFAAGGIPIYWGDPQVGRYFNTKAFINIMDYASLDDVIGEIKRIDKDNELYQKYLREPALLDENYVNCSLERLEHFLRNIIEQPLEIAKRRTTGAWSHNITEIVRKGTISQESLKTTFWKRRIKK